MKIMLDSSAPPTARVRAAQRILDGATLSGFRPRRRRPILNHTNRRELVYDPFLGSGTTLIAAQQTGRICSGLELDPKYVDVMIGRWQQMSGKAARLERQGTFVEMEARRRSVKP